MKASPYRPNFLNLTIVVLIFIITLLITSIISHAWQYQPQAPLDEQINRNIQDQRVISEMQRQTFELQNQRIRPPCQVPVAPCRQPCQFPTGKY